MTEGDRIRSLILGNFIHPTPMPTNLAEYEERRDKGRLHRHTQALRSKEIGRNKYFVT